MLGAEAAFFRSLTGKTVSRCSRCPSLAQISAGIWKKKNFLLAHAKVFFGNEWQSQRITTCNNSCCSATSFHYFSFSELHIYIYAYNTADRFAAHHPLLVFAWAWILVCLDNHQLILHWKPLAIVDWMVCASYIIIAWDGGWIMTRFALLAPWVNKSGGTAAQGRPGAHSPIQISLTTLFNHVKPQKIFIAKAVFVMNQRDSLMFDSADSSRLSWSLPELLRTT